MVLVSGGSSAGLSRRRHRRAIGGPRGEIGHGGPVPARDGVLEGRACWAAEVAPDAGSPEGRVFRDLRSLFSGVSEDFFMFPPLPPGVSIARAMIDGFVAQHG